TVPFRLIDWLASNSAANEWWAIAVAAASTNPAAAANAANLVLIETSVHPTRLSRVFSGLESEMSNYSRAIARIIATLGLAAEVACGGPQPPPYKPMPDVKQLLPG